MVGGWEVGGRGWEWNHSLCALCASVVIASLVNSRSSLNPIPLPLFQQRLAVDTEDLRRARVVRLRLAQDIADVTCLQLVKSPAVDRCCGDKIASQRWQR